MPYEGPFLVVGRPSRSTIKIEVGQFKSGEKRYEIRHINDIKAAHPQSMAAPAQRPVLGRPPQSTAQSDRPQATDASQPSPLLSSPSTLLSDRVGAKIESEPANKNKQPVADNKTWAPANNESESHATSSQLGRIPSPVTGPPSNKPFSRPVRSTRNPNPVYMDAIWSASNADLEFINNSIVTRNLG